MYPRFLQFTMPKVGQAAMAAALYFYFYHIPLFALLQDRPVLRLLAALAAVAGISRASRDPLGPGMVAAGYFTALCYLSWGAELLCGAWGGGAAAVYRVLSLWGLAPVLVTAVILLLARRRARKLCVTTYRLTTRKPLPGGRLRVVQLSDLHPNPAAALHSGRIEELRRKVEDARPDLLVLTGDVFDEYTPRAEFETFTALFGQLHAPLGKFFVYGNHDVFSLHHEPSFTRQELEQRLAAAGVTVLQDREALPDARLRVVGRKDYLFTGGRRLPAQQLCRPDDVYTVWLDHEPRELKKAAAAGADLILCGHTHGGQIWPGGVAGRMVHNEMNYGLRRIGETAAITSGGTGTWGYRLRTQGRTEVVVAEIKSTAGAEKP